MQTIVITGASDGIGAAAARALQAKGHQVVLVGRSAAKTEALARALQAPFHIADFTRLDQVRDLAHKLRDLPRIDVLANNAGGLMGARELTPDGFEKTFQVNHLAPFLLTRLLIGSLSASRAKVIQTSSMAANLWGAGFDIDDLQSAQGYRATTAYGRAKLANILMTRELHRRFHPEGIAAVAFHPGVVRSQFAAEASLAMRWLYRSPLRYLMTSPETSARRLCALALGEPGRDWQSGLVYDGARPMPVRFADPEGRVAQSLWRQSETMVAPWL